MPLLQFFGISTVHDGFQDGVLQKRVHACDHVLRTRLKVFQKILHAALDALERRVRDCLLPLLLQLQQRTRIRDILLEPLRLVVFAGMQFLPDVRKFLELRELFRRKSPQGTRVAYGLAQVGGDTVPVAATHGLADIVVVGMVRAVVTHLRLQHLPVVLDLLLLFLVGAPVVLRGLRTARTLHLVRQFFNGRCQVLVALRKAVHQRVHLLRIAVGGEQPEAHRVQDVTDTVEQRAADLREELTGKDVFQNAVYGTEHRIEDIAHQRADALLQHVKDGKHRRDDLADDAPV